MKRVHFLAHALAVCALFFIAPAVWAANDITYLDDEAEGDDFDITATLAAPPAELVLCEQENGDGYHLKLSASKIELFTQQEKRATLLASAVEKPTGTIVVQRRGPAWRLIAGNRVLLEAEDDRWHTGKLGVRGLKDPRVQPVEDTVFDDDFMRVAAEVALAGTKEDPRKGVRILDVKTEETLWKTVTGTWSTTGLNENDQAEVAQSANPFAFKADTAGANLTLAGRPFWNDYAAEVSVKPEGATAVGLAVYGQDAKNYLMLHWGAAGPLQLRAIIDGQTRVLDEAPGGYEQKQWYRLRLSAARGVLRAYIDDAEVLRARTGLFGRGLVGLYSDNPSAKESAFFDDVKVRSSHDLEEDFAAPVPGRWQTVTGKWKLNGAAAPATREGAFAVMGEGAWKNYTTAARIALPADGAAGLVLHHQAGKGAYLLRVAASKAALPYAGKAQIIRISGGKTEVLGEAAIGNRFDKSSETWSFSDENGYLRGSVGDAMIVDAYDDSLQAGRAGIYAQAGARDGAPQLTQFSVGFPEVRTSWSKVPELYTDNRQAETMGGWSTPQGLWTAQPLTISATTGTSQNLTGLWHKGIFWGDRSLRFKLPVLTAEQKLSLTFENAQPSNTAQTPLALTFSLNNGQLQVTAASGDDKAKNWNGQLKLTGAMDNQVVEIDRRGTYLLVHVGEGNPSQVLLAARVS